MVAFVFVFVSVLVPVVLPVVAVSVVSDAEVPVAVVAVSVVAVSVAAVSVVVDAKTGQLDLETMRATIHTCALIQSITGVDFSVMPPWPSRGDRAQEQHRKQKCEDEGSHRESCGCKSGCGGEQSKDSRGRESPERVKEPNQQPLAASGSVVWLETVDREQRSLKGIVDLLEFDGASGEI